METLRPSIATSHFSEAVFSMIREIYGRTSGDPMNDLDVNLAIWVNVHEYHSSSNGSSRKRPWSEFKIGKESSLEHCGTAFQGNKEAGQWSDQPLAQAWLISRIWGGCRQAHCTVELINIPLPKPTSSPTLYSVWEKWEMTFLQPARAKFNGVTTIISKIWVDLMDNLWNSSGRFYQDPPRWESSIRFNRWWEN